MTKTNKKILLGTTAAIAAVAIPVATVVSCGSKESKKGTTVDLIENAKFSDWYESNPITQSILTAKDGEYFNVHTMNFDNAKTAATKHSWTTLYTKTVDLDRHMDLKTVAKKINDEIKAKISGLSPLHKRTLVYGATDITPSDAGAKRKYSVTVFDSLAKSATKLPDKQAQYINAFLKSSNIKADVYTDDANLDTLKPKANSTTLEHNVYRYFTGATSFRKNENYDVTLYVDSNNIFNTGASKLFLDDMLSKKIITKREDKGIDTIVEPRTDLNKGHFIENISFFDEAAFETEDPVTGSPYRHSQSQSFEVESIKSTNYYKEFKTVFTVNPIVQDIKDKTVYSKVTELTDDQLVDYLSRGVHSLLLNKTAELGKTLLQGIQLIQAALPPTTPFAAPSLPWAKDVTAIYNEQVKKLGKNNTGAIVKATVLEVSKIIRTKLPEIKKAITASSTTSLKRIAYAYNRDLNAKFQNAIVNGGTKTSFTVDPFKGDVDKSFDNLVTIGGKELLDANKFLLTTLFDSMNSMVYMADILHKAYNAKSTPAPNVYK